VVTESIGSRAPVEVTKHIESSSETKEIPVAPAVETKEIPVATAVETEGDLAVETEG